MEKYGWERKRQRVGTAEYYDSMSHQRFDNSVAPIDPRVLGSAAPAGGTTLEATNQKEIVDLLNALSYLEHQRSLAQMAASNVYQPQSSYLHPMPAGARLGPTMQREFESLLNSLLSFYNQLDNAEMDACHVYEHWTNCMNAFLAQSTVTTAINNNNYRTNTPTKLRVSERSAFTPYKEYALRQQEAAARAEEKSRLSFQQIEAAAALIQWDESSLRSREAQLRNAGCIEKNSKKGFTHVGQGVEHQPSGNGITGAADGLQDVAVPLAARKESSNDTESDGVVNASARIPPHEAEDNNDDNTLESGRYCENWMRQYDALKAYCNKYGEYPSGYKSALGVWVNTQRSSYKSKAKNRDTSLMSSTVAERIRLLESLPKWTWDFNEPTIEHKGTAGVTVKLSANQDRYQKEWLVRYNELKTYFESHKKYPITKNDSLGSWIHTQRSAYKRLKNKSPVDRGGWPKPLESIRIHLLEQLPGWKWDNSENSASRPDHTAWSTKFDQLVAYLQNNNGLYPPSHWKDGHEDTKSLSRWVSGQILEFKRGKLEDCRVCNLQSLPGWSFTEPLLTVENPEGLTRADREDAWWSERFNHLKSYLQEKNNLYPKDRSGAPASIRSLVKWIYSQLRAYKNGTLAQDRREKLSTLPGWSFTEPLKRALD